MTHHIPLEQFESTFNKLIEQKQPFIGVFTSDKDANGQSWCPDCMAAEPHMPDIVKRAHENKMEIYFFTCGPREVYKRPDHPFRTHKMLKLTGIPTVAYFDGKGIPRRLMESEILDEFNREMLFDN